MASPESASWRTLKIRAMAGPMVEVLEIKNELSEVGRANDALRELWVRCALPEEFEMPVTLCPEEVLSNVIRHGCRPGQQCDIHVRYTVFERGIEVEVSDDARAFDPSVASAARSNCAARAAQSRRTGRVPGSKNDGRGAL